MKRTHLTGALALALCLIASSAMAIPTTCTTDAECDDGLFCTGAEQCINSACAAVSACPPAIDGCVERGAYCDEENDVCVDVPNDAWCDDGIFCNGVNFCEVETGLCNPGLTCPIALNGCVVLGGYCNEDTDTCENYADDSFCDNGVFCDGWERCDINTGLCVAVSSCPPFIDGCLEGGACDEENDKCYAVPQDDLCAAGQTCTSDGTCASPIDLINGAIASIEALRDAGEINSGIATSLITKLNGALASLARGQTTAACNKLAAFIDQVYSLRADGVLSADDADALTEAIAAARNGLGCALPG